MINKNSLKNLHPAKKGEVRNPRGRPRNSECLLDCIKKELLSKSINGQTKEQMIAAALVQMAEKGNLKAIEILMSYMISKPTQGLDVTSKGNEIKMTPIIQVVSDNARQLTDKIVSGVGTESLTTPTISDTITT